MLNAIPFFGWFLSIVVSISLSIPFFIVWNALAPTYFYFLPQVYLAIPFWDCVGLFIIIPILKWMVPTLVSSSSSSKVKEVVND